MSTKTANDMMAWVEACRDVGLRGHSLTVYGDGQVGLYACTDEDWRRKGIWAPTAGALISLLDLYERDSVLRIAALEARAEIAGMH